MIVTITSFKVLLDIVMVHLHYCYLQHFVHAIADDAVRHFKSSVLRSGWLSM